MFNGQLFYDSARAKEIFLKLFIRLISKLKLWSVNNSIIKWEKNCIVVKQVCCCYALMYHFPCSSFTNKDQWRVYVR